MDKRDKGGGPNCKNIFLVLFHVSEYLEQFKAIKWKSVKGVGP